MPTFFERYAKHWKQSLEYWADLRKRRRVQFRLDHIVQECIRVVRSEIVEVSPPVASHLFYGATAIDPKYLAVWFIFNMDTELTQARMNGLADRIVQSMRRELTVRGYPKPNQAHIGFTTDEDIRSKTGGNYRQYFQ